MEGSTVPELLSVINNVPMLLRAESIAAILCSGSRAVGLIHPYFSKTFITVHTGVLQNSKGLKMVKITVPGIGL